MSHVKIDEPTSPSKKIEAVLVDNEDGVDVVREVVKVAETVALTDVQLRADPVPVSGTVAVTGTQTDGLTNAELRASAIPTRSPEHGATPGYAAGTGGGTVSIPAGARLLAVSAHAEAVAGTFSVAGGDDITVRADRDVDWNQRGNAELDQADQPR